jgi:hypothetical protein
VSTDAKIVEEFIAFYMGAKDSLGILERIAEKRREA